jgi:hypothetical protein
MKQFSSKLNTGLIVILIILVLALLGMVGYKNYKTTTILNNFEDTITDQDYDELAAQVQQQQMENSKNSNSSEKIYGLVSVDKSDGNPSARSADRFAIIQTDLYPEITRPICGSGNEFLSPCIFSLERNTGEIIKVGEWPSQDIKTQYPDLFGSNNLYVNQSVLLDSSRIFFDSSFEEGCASKIIQHWYFDIETKKFKLQNTEKIIDKNGC